MCQDIPRVIFSTANPLLLFFAISFMDKRVRRLEGSAITYSATAFSFISLTLDREGLVLCLLVALCIFHKKSKWTV